MISDSLIPSIYHQARISDLCSSLKSIADIRYYVLYIIFNNGKKFVLSSTPEDFLMQYWHEKLNELDHSTDLDLFNQHKDYYLCNEKLGAELAFKETIESRFKMFRTFYTKRECAECRFVFGALHNYQVINPGSLYKANIEKFEDFSIDFIDGTIDLIKIHNPTYSNSIILTDKIYRKSIIKGNQIKSEPLTERETQCLYWAAHGKSSEETAVILNIRKSTVEDYRKQIKKKLNCNSMAHAIYEGVKHGYIGAFHQINSNYF